MVKDAGYLPLSPGQLGSMLQVPARRSGACGGAVGPGGEVPARAGKQSAVTAIAARHTVRAPTIATSTTARPKRGILLNIGALRRGGWTSSRPCSLARGHEGAASNLENVGNSEFALQNRAQGKGAVSLIGTPWGPSGVPSAARLGGARTDRRP